MAKWLLSIWASYKFPLRMGLQTHACICSHLCMWLFHVYITIKNQPGVWNSAWGMQKFTFRKDRLPSRPSTRNFASRSSLVISRNLGQISLYPDVLLCFLMGNGIELGPSAAGVSWLFSSYWMDVHWLAFISYCGITGLRRQESYFIIYIYI